MAHLIMNHYQYGPGYGYPLSILDWEREGDILRIASGNQAGLLIQRGRTAKIIKDNLFIRSTLNFRIPPERLRELRGLREDRFLGLCPHLILWLSVPELAEAVDAPFTECPLSGRSCLSCMTDYSIAIQRWKQHGWQIKMNVYEQLGECRSPRNWDWDSRAWFPKCSKLPTRIDRYGASSAGSVMETWMRQVAKDKKANLSVSLSAMLSKTSSYPIQLATTKSPLEGQL